MAYKIFQIDTSIKQTQDSFTRRTGQYFIRKFQEKFGQLEVSYLDLAKNPPAYITAGWYDAASLPPGARSSEQNKLLLEPNMQPLRDCGLWLFDLAGYMYDAPASFKSWLEHAVQIGLTVDEEWKPLLSGKRVVVISAWGGSEDEVSPELGFASALRKAMKFIGVEDITFFNIFNTEEITATEDDAQRAISRYISDLQL